MDGGTRGKIRRTACLDGEGWETAEVEPGKWWEIWVVIEGGRTVIVSWGKEEERVAGLWRKEREEEKADKTPITPGVTALIERFQGAVPFVIMSDIQDLLPCSMTYFFALCLFASTQLQPAPRSRPCFVLLAFLFVFPSSFCLSSTELN